MAKKVYDGCPPRVRDRDFGREHCIELDKIFDRNNTMSDAISKRDLGGLSQIANY